MGLRVVPVRFTDAGRFVEGWHRKHPRPPKGTVFCLGVADDDNVLRGVAMVGRPKAPAYDNGMTLEVNRTTTDGCPNANSMIYAAAWRAAKALGYRRLITYTEEGESGSSLRAAGWRVLAERPARAGWDTPSRPRDNGSYLSTTRTLWEAAQ